MSRSSASIRPRSTAAWTSAPPSPTRPSAPRVPHHLIDLLDPEQAYSAAQFVHDATAAAAEIRARGRLPLLVGGTMLYFKALRDGLDRDARRRPGAARTASTRARPPRAGRRCMPSCSASTRPPRRGWRRTMRSASSARSRCGCRPAGRCRPSMHAARHGPMPARWPLVTLEPDSRAWLHERIARRFDAMLAAGFVDEVRRLRQRPAPAAADAVDALRRLPPGLGGAGRGRWTACARPASPPRGNWPSASSPGCARWTTARASSAMRPTWPARLLDALRRASGR